MRTRSGRKYDDKQPPIQIKSAAKEVKSPTKGVKSPAKQLKSSAKGVKSPAKEVKQSVRVRSSAREAKPPAKEVKSPESEAISSAKEVKSSAKDVKSPVKEVKSSARLRSSAKDVKSPTREAIPPVKEVKPSAKDVKSPVKEVKSSARLRSSAKEVKSPAREAIPPVKEVKPSAKEVKSPASEAISLAKEVKPPVKEVKPSARLRSSAKEVKSPAKEAISPVNEVKSSAEEVKSPTKEVKSSSRLRSSAKDVKSSAKEVKPSIRVRSSAREAKPPAKEVKPSAKAVKSLTKDVKSPAKDSESTAEETTSNGIQIIEESVSPKTEEINKTGVKRAISVSNDGIEIMEESVPPKTRVKRAKRTNNISNEDMKAVEESVPISTEDMKTRGRRIKTDSNDDKTTVEESDLLKPEEDVKNSSNNVSDDDMKAEELVPQKSEDNCVNSEIKIITEVSDDDIEVVEESISPKEDTVNSEESIISVSNDGIEIMEESVPPKTEEIKKTGVKRAISVSSDDDIQVVEESVPQKSEAIKRLRVSRFSVPSIPQISGQLHSFGEEIAGELGPRLRRVDDIRLKSNEPSIVTDKDGLSLDNIVSVVCGAMHSSCISSNGEVITFGCNDDSALGRDTQTGSDQTDDSIDVDESEEKEAKTPKLVSGLPPVVKVTAGDMHTCALTTDGSVYVWGNFKDESKKLGLFAESLKMENSDDMIGTTLPQQIPLETRIVDIASGCHHILLLTEDGDVLSFGEGSKGQLGRIKDTELQTISSNRQLFLNPQKVEFGVGIVVQNIWANHWSSYAKTSSGDIYVWGLNNYNQLGLKSNGSVQVINSDPNESQQSINLIIELKPIKAEKMPSNVVMIANGQHHMLALDSDGQVFSCGSNTYGKLGYKTDNSDQTVESPQMIESLEKVTHIACGEFCSFAITESGHVMAWGQGSAHIGSEDFQDCESPTRIMGTLAVRTRFLSVSSGSQHSLLIGSPMNSL